MTAAPAVEGLPPGVERDWALLEKYWREHLARDRYAPAAADDVIRKMRAVWIALGPWDRIVFDGSAFNCRVAVMLFKLVRELHAKESIIAAAKHAGALIADNDGGEIPPHAA